MRILRWLWMAPRRAVVLLIVVYQKTLSPDHGLFKHRFAHGYCPFTPSCSEYGRRALVKYGLVYGGIKTAWRICRCHPWTHGGVDLP